MKLAHNMVVAGFALAAILTDPVPTDDATLIKSEDEFFLQLDEQAGESLVDFLDLASTLLDTPIEYSPLEIGDARMFVTGMITVPKQDLHSFVEMMLEMKGFLLVEEEYGERTILRVLRKDVYNSRHPTRHWIGDAKNVLAEDMEFWKNRRALITTTVALQNIHARDAQRSLEPYIDERIGSVRSIEKSNALVITAKANAVYKMLEVVQTIDIASELKTGSSHLGERVSQVEERLAALEDC